jgi:hypothetical protein
MSSSERATAARLPADPIALEAGRSVAALFDVLERAGGGAVYPRSPSRRPAHYRPAGARTGGVRTVPLRSVQPAPMARPVRTVVVPPPRAVPAVPAPAPGRLSAVIRRAALWGAGPQGEYLAWRPSARHTSRPAAPVAGPVRAGAQAPWRPTRTRRMLAWIALWGAGSDGQYLAWGAPQQPLAKPWADRPVVLREMPSTPTIPPPMIAPAASSPAAALNPHGPASTGPRWMPPVPRGAVAVPGVRPRGRPERSLATGWPPQVPASGVATGLVRTRGDPLSSPARGSPARPPR